LATVSVALAAQRGANFGSLAAKARYERELQIENGPGPQVSAC